MYSTVTLVRVSLVVWIGVSLIGVSLVVCLGRLLQRLLLVDAIGIHTCVCGCELVLLIIVLRHLLVP